MEITGITNICWDCDDEYNTQHLPSARTYSWTGTGREDEVCENCCKTTFVIEVVPRSWNFFAG